MLLSLCLGFSGAAQASEALDVAFAALDLQEVLDLEITSVSKKPQMISRAAAAAYVITGDDIRRMGVQNIADALRLAPGAWRLACRSARSAAIRGR